MAIAKTIEIPTGMDRAYWIERDGRIDRLGRKNMDAWANVPLDQIPSDEVERNKANFKHYSTMMDKASRAYIWETLKGKLIPHMQAHTEDKPYVLMDAGAGNGRVAKKLAPLLKQTVAGETELILAERSAPPLEDARTYFAQSDANHNQKITFLHEDLNRLSLPSESVHAIACVMVLHHQKLGEIIQTLSELTRILKPGGIAVLMDTGALPEKGWQRFIVPKVVKLAISPDKMIAQDKKAGVPVKKAQMEGYQDFGKRDGLLAFDFAIDPQHWQELKYLPLGQHMREIGSFNTSNRIVSKIFPDLNSAVAVKK